MKRAYLTAAFLYLAVAGQASTWHVAKDGTGDFTVIQDAVDVASDGDVIWIHAGRYDEIQHDVPLFGEGYAFRADTHVAIWKDNLTLRGDGPDETIIGSEETPPPPPTFRQFGIGVTHFFASSLTIENLRIEHVLTGVYAVNPEITVEGCEFAEIANQGMVMNLQVEAVVHDCSFVGIGAYGAGAHDVDDVMLRECSFDDCGIGAEFTGTANAVVESCTFVEGIAGIQYEQGAVGYVVGSTVTDSAFYGLVASTGSIVDIADSEFSGGDCGIWVSSPSTSVKGTGCLLSGHSYASILVDFGQLALHEFDIINGGGFSVLCRGGSLDSYHIDLTNNYWGTDDADQIAEWIWDAVDDPELSCTVDYIPFQGIVAVESHTWSEIKSMFRDK